MKGKKAGRRTFRKAKKSLGAKVEKLERMVKEDKPEMKFQAATRAVISSLVQSTPQYILLNGLSPGTNELNNRIGAKVRWKFLNLKYCMRTVIATLPTGTTTFGRVMLICDKMPQGTAIPLGNVLYDSPPYALSQKDYVTRASSRFKILYDKVHILSNFGGNSQVGYNEKYFVLNMVTEYQRNTTGDITDIDKCSLYLIFMSDNVTASAVTVEYTYSLGYLDS